MALAPDVMDTAATNHWSELARRALAGERLSREDGLSVLQAADDDVLPVLHAAFTVRKAHYGRRVKVNMLINAKSGWCPENCGYCSQSSVSSAPVKNYTLVDKDTLIAGAQAAMEREAGTYCIVCSGRGPTNKDLGNICEAVREIKATMPLKICACLGILKDGQAARLKEAGVDRYNHNINTSTTYHASVTTSHTYEDRIRTLESIKNVGISPCSGVIVGMGESDDDILDMAYALRDLDADSIPVNFLHPVEGTPMAGKHELTPFKCLKVLALFRLVCPSKEIRASGGRELNLRSVQALALYPANSIFIGDYLTTEGQSAEADRRMIADTGFEIEVCAVN